MLDRVIPPGPSPGVSPMIARPASLALACCLLPVLSVAAAPPEGVEFFEKKVRPVLAEHCYQCHSSQAKKVRGSLRLDSRANTLKGGDTGPAIVPGKPEQSLLLKAIS